MRCAFLCFAFLALAGCISFTKPYKVASHQNVYDHELARFRKLCGTPATCQVATDGCQALCVALETYDSDLHAADKALKWGGAMPRQLADLERDREAVDKVK